MCSKGNCTDNETLLCHSVALAIHRVMTTNGNVTSNDSVLDEINRALDNIPVKLGWLKFVLPIISFLGVIGNLLNLLVLTRRRMLSSMDRLEKSATYGLVALALSDMLFCVTVFPHGLMNEERYMVDRAHQYILYYKLHGLGLVNLFLMISTWLIVTMSISRYIVVVYPLHARSTLSTFHTAVTIVLVYAISTVMTLPFFLHAKVGPCRSIGQYLQYEFQSTFGHGVTKWLLFYMKWVWPIIADFIPFGILAFCNIRLILELKHAINKRQRTAQGQVVQDSSQKITLTLVIIVLMLLLLVSPSEIMRYINPYESWGYQGYTVASITNVLQAINFAFNFILYCVVSATFRQTFKSMFSFCCSKNQVEKTEMQCMLNTHANHTDKSIIMDTEIE